MLNILLNLVCSYSFLFIFYRSFLLKKFQSFFFIHQETSDLKQEKIHNDSNQNWDSKNKEISNSFPNSQSLLHRFCIIGVGKRSIGNW